MNNNEVLTCLESDGQFDIESTAAAFGEKCDFLLGEND